MSYFKETKIIDSSGNVMEGHLQTDGDYHLGTTISQSVYVSTGNASSTNLAAGATWAGEPVSTLGVVGLQWNLNTDQNCTIYSEESEGSHTGLGTLETAETTTLLGTDTVFERSFVVGDTISVEGETDRIVATIVSDTELTVTVAFATTDTGLTYTHYHWDISYPFDFTADTTGEGETVQATMAYWRLRVVNEGMATTTFFRVSGVLCPIATPLPSSLSSDRRLKVESTLSGRENTGRHVWVNPTNELAVSPVYRLVGTAFDGVVLDDNFWTDGSLDGGSVTQGGSFISLETNTTINGSAKYSTIRYARFVAGSAMLFVAGVNFDTAATANNKRMVGAYDTNDGYFFQLDGTTFSIGTRNATVDTLVNSGSFDGNLGVAWTPTAGTFYKFSIEYTPLGAFWYVGGKLLHKINAAELTQTSTLPVTFENINDGIDTDIEFQSIGAYIARQGELVTNPTSKYITTADTYICKRGAGVLLRIIINDPSTGTLLSIYDDAAAAGTTIGVITLGAKAVSPTSIEYGVPFSNGLTIITTGTWNVTVVYE